MTNLAAVGPAPDRCHPDERPTGTDGDLSILSDEPDRDIRSPFRILVVDDHEVVRSGLLSLVERTDDLVVVGEAATSAEALSLLETVDPDVVVLDVRLPDQDGIELCREIRSRPTAPGCLVLTSFGGDDLFLRAAVAGASGFMLKTAGGQEVLAAIRRVATGEVLFDAAETAAALARVGVRRTPRAALSPQQSRIFDLLAQGLTNREIASLMHLSEKTVRNYVSAVLLKLGLRRRSEVAALAAGIRRSAPDDDR